MFYKRIYQMFAFIGLLIFIFLYGFNFTKSPKVEDFVEALTFTLLGISLMFFKPSEKIAKRLKKRFNTYKACQYVMLGIFVCFMIFSILAIILLDIDTFCYNYFFVVFSLLLSIIISVCNKIDRLFDKL